MEGLDIYKLSNENIVLAEEAILSDKLKPISKNYMLSISLEYYELAKLGYLEMIQEETPVTSYMKFAFNGGGMQCYGFYKAKNGTVYVIDSFMNNISGVYIPDKNMDCLRDIV
jgi:hypothetical protein